MPAAFAAFLMMMGLLTTPTDHPVTIAAQARLMWLESPALRTSGRTRRGAVAQLLQYVSWRAAGGQ